MRSWDCALVWPHTHFMFNRFRKLLWCVSDCNEEVGLVRSNPVGSTEYLGPVMVMIIYKALISQFFPYLIKVRRCCVAPHWLLVLQCPPALQSLPSVLASELPSPSCDVVLVASRHCWSHFQLQPSPVEPKNEHIHVYLRLTFWRLLLSPKSMVAYP